MVVDGTYSGSTPKILEIYVIGMHDFTGDTLQVKKPIRIPVGI